MDRQHPVYTVETECQDCYKCVRQCPVKAIKVSHGHAQILPTLCVACGHCVLVCPARAKRVRDDLGRAQHLLAGSKPVYLSLAPSWVGEFPELDEAHLVQACWMLGFAGVSETALGAEHVSDALAGLLAAQPQGLHISTACPAAVAFVLRHLPVYRDRLTPLASPLLAHAKLLRTLFGEDIAIVFVGPCVAKKLEADSHPDLLQLALTFQDLRRWWSDTGTAPDSLAPEPDARFIPNTAEEGALYPMAGGMIQTLRLDGRTEGMELVDVRGLRTIDNALDGFDAEGLERGVFLETLACDGGCIAGPCMSRTRSGLDMHVSVRARVGSLGDARGGCPPPRADVPLRHGKGTSRGTDPAPPQPHRVSRMIRIEPGMVIPPPASLAAPPAESTVYEALRRVGKIRPDDELNCGGCGYDTCRLFAKALVAGNAEPAMCASYMRQRAQRKANALLRCIPSGVVIADRDLRVIECNRPFADMFGEETGLAFDAHPGMEGALLERILPFGELFRMALRSGEDVRREHLPVNGKLLDIAVFTVEPGQTVGAVIQDVTATELRREQIARRAREVIRKNLATVQEIACRLGEHMADTEIILGSIAEDYGSEGTVEALSHVCPELGMEDAP